MYEDLLVFGVISGAMYALLALGFTLIYGVAEVVNMAHGALYMLGAYMFTWFSGFWAVKEAGLTSVPQPYLLLAFVLAVICVGIIGAIIYMLAYDPVIGDIVALLVVTIGVAIIIQQGIAINWGHTHTVVNLYTPGIITLLGVKVKILRALSAVISAVLFFSLWLFIAKTKIGGAMRATAQDREVAMLMGINTRRLSMMTMAISSSLSATAGILTVTSTTKMATPYLWLTPLALAFACVILGGLGSIKGSFIAAFIIAFAERAFLTFTPGNVSYLRGAFALAVMAAVLLLRPKGLFGKRVELE